MSQNLQAYMLNARVNNASMKVWCFHSNSFDLNDLILHNSTSDNAQMSHILTAKECHDISQCMKDFPFPMDSTTTSP